MAVPPLRLRAIALALRVGLAFAAAHARSLRYAAKWGSLAGPPTLELLYGGSRQSAWVAGAAISALVCRKPNYSVRQAVVSKPAGIG